MKLRLHIKFEIATGLVGWLPVIDPRRWGASRRGVCRGGPRLAFPEMARPCRFHRLPGSNFGTLGDRIW